MLNRSEQWPPDYKTVVAIRAARALKMRTTPGAVGGARDYYKNNPADFIEHWVDTFDPRNAGTLKPTRMPFVLFPRQREFIDFLYACSRSETHGLIEKSRDMGATWL